MKVFILQRVSAVALVIFMTLHMVVVHFPVRDLEFSEVFANRMSQPVWQGMYILFLLTVLVHGLAGAYMVLTDVGSVAKYKKSLAWVAIGLGVIYFIYGAMTILSFRGIA